VWHSTLIPDFIGTLGSKADMRYFGKTLKKIDLNTILGGISSPLCMIMVEQHQKKPVGAIRAL
jgi:hypothetical protein